MISCEVAMRNPLRAYRVFLLTASVILSTAALAAQATPEAKPWYAAELSKLGFTVFPEPVDVGDFSVQALGGAPTKLSDQRDKLVLLNFWATWCPPCRAEMPAIEKLWIKAKSGAFTVMGISLGEEEGTVKAFIAKNGFTYPIFLDRSGDVGKAFRADAIPTTYIINKKGKAIAGIVGGAAYESAEAIELFSKLSAE